ncbi:T9SS type A sorting domain-containing protein [Flavobacterium sp. D33]|nr:T9SS type A sorting domain-containing protein [Flavobacterium selenitireducens]
MDILQSIRLTPDGGFILAGTSTSGKGLDKTEGARGLSDFWVIKLDAGGGLQWQKTIGGIDSDELVAVLVSKDGKYLLGGTSASGISGEKTDKNRGGTDLWIVQLDGSGNIEWQQTYGGLYNEQLRGLCPAPSGGYMVLGYTNSPESDEKKGKGFGKGDFWVLRLDVRGEQLWQQTFGGDLDDQPFTILALNNGDYLLGGNSASGTSGNKTTSARSGSDFWVVRMDEQGNSVWQESYDFGKYDILTSLTENPDGSILIGGHAKTETRGKSKEEEGINDYIALKVKANGEEIWNRHLGSDGDDILRKLIQTRDGGYLLAGTSNAAKNNYALRRKNGKRKNQGLSVAGKGESLAVSDNAQKEVDETLTQGRDAVNDIYKEHTEGLRDELSEALGSQDGPIKTGIAVPTNVVGQGSGKSAGVDADALSGLSGNNYQKQPASKNKTLNYGTSDFWVIKLKDKDKKEKARQSIEAAPNPARNYTNVIIGYDFEKGTATVFDIAGHMLQSFEITTGRTVPIDLGSYPEGIYIVEVKTEKSTDAVKVMKSR